MPDELENDGGTEVETPTTPNASNEVESDVPDSPEFENAWANAFGKSDSEGNATEPNDEGEAEATADGAGEKVKDGEPTEPADDKGEKPEAPKPADEKVIKEALGALPSTLRAAAQRAGYTDADLAKDINDLGVERVSATLERWHGGFNELSSRLSQLGRVAQPPAQPGQQTQQQPAQSNVTRLDALLEPQKLAQFQANYGQELVDQVLKPLFAELQEYREMRADWDAQKRTGLQQEINSVFAGLGSEFESLIGKGAMEQISPDAKEQRMSVLREADLIMAGAERSGVAMTTKEAIERAFNLVVAPKRAEFERKALAGRIQKRSKSITARPTSRRTANTAATGAKKSDASAVEALGKREAELGINFFED